MGDKNTATAPQQVCWTCKHGTRPPSVEPCDSCCVGSLADGTFEHRHWAPARPAPQQRRERLIECLCDNGTLGFDPDIASHIADAISASDRAAGCDPGALRAEIEAWKASDNAKLDRIARHQRERDEALAERDELAARLAVVVDAATAYRDAYGSTTVDTLDTRDYLFSVLTDLPARAALTESGAAPQPDPDGWIPWTGGDRPVDAEVEIQWKGVDGSTGEACADQVVWQHGTGSYEDVIAYRVRHD
ncbi:hypothetical protein [Phaeospirillum tilakii]|uniref:Uncharacterized protein n=1 Tax=Phaeospirillum tilakii TaxID=741673 RepID=A0ABW5CFA6_9PROT